MHSGTNRLVGLVALFALSGCVSRADFDKVRHDHDSLRAQVADVQANTDGLKRQVDALRATLDDLTSRGVRGTPGANAELQRRIDALEARLAANAATASPNPAEVVLPVATLTTAAGTPAAAIALKRDEALVQAGNAPEPFRTGLELYKQGQWEKARAKFRELVQTMPKSDYADNAQYWIGETYYNQKDFNHAIPELNEVLSRYPKGERLPQALLALAVAFADSGDKVDAGLILQKLINDHPGTEEATIAQERLKSLSRQ